jgi:hypothetical protein
MLRRDGVNDPNPRKQFRKDLLKCMKKCITDKEEILLVGDFRILSLEKVSVRFI